MWRRTKLMRTVKDQCRWRPPWPWMNIPWRLLDWLHLQLFMFRQQRQTMAISKSQRLSAYLRSDYHYTYELTTLRSAFSSFNYHYWMIIKELRYDFNNLEFLRSKQWSPTSWMCSTADVIGGQSCTSGEHPKAPVPWLVTPQNFEVDHCLSQYKPEQCSLQYSCNQA